VKKILIVAALPYELAPARKLIKQFLGVGVLIETKALGVGPKKSARALENLLEEDSRWDLILMVGLAGALNPSLQSGDWIVPSWIMDESNQLIKPGELSEESTHSNIKTLPFFTSHKILKPTEKEQLLSQAPELSVVDMESFAVAAVLERRQIPYNILRVILDEANFVFPDFTWIFRKATFLGTLKFLFFWLKNPKAGWNVLMYERNLKRSLGRLQHFLITWLSHVLSDKEGVSLKTKEAKKCA